MILGNDKEVSLAGGRSHSRSCAVTNVKQVSAASPGAKYGPAAPLLVLCALALAGLLAPAHMSPAHAASGPAVRYGEIQTRIEEGDYQTAARELREFIRMAGGWERIEEARVLYGEMLLRSGDVAAAQEELLLLLGRAHQFNAELVARIRYALAETYEAMGQYPYAVIAYEQVFQRHTDSLIGPEAALRGAKIAEKVMQNRRRARDIYQSFMEKYSDRPEMPAVVNHIAYMSEQGPGDEEFELAVERDREDHADLLDQLLFSDDDDEPERRDRDLLWGPEAAYELYIEYAGRFPDHGGDVSLTPAAAAGPEKALWRAVHIAENELQDDERALSALELYVKLDDADRGEAYWRMAGVLERLGRGDEAGSALLKAAESDSDPLRRIDVAQRLQQKEQDDRAAGLLLELVGSAEDWSAVERALGMLGADRIIDYLDANRCDFHVMRFLLRRLESAGEKEQGRDILDRWLAGDGIDWKTAIAADWYGRTGEPQDAERALAAAEKEGQVAMIGQYCVETADLDIMAAALERWGAYPDFPAANVLGKLAELGMDREKLVGLIEKNDLREIAEVCGLLAELLHELGRDGAVDVSIAAAEKLMQARSFVPAARHIQTVLDSLGSDDMRSAKLLFAAAQAGTERQWGEQWEGLLAPAAQRGYDGARRGNAEEQRLAALRFSRCLPPETCISAADNFLQHHSDSPHAAFARRERFRAMHRSESEDLADAISGTIEKIGENPSAITWIPPELVHPGPGGMAEYTGYALDVIANQRGDLKADAMLSLAQAYFHQGDMAGAADMAEKIIDEHDGARQAGEAVNLLERIFARGFLPPDVAHGTVLTAYRRSAGRALERKAGTAFGDFAGGLWRLACHPAYMPRGFHDYDSLYLYSGRRSVSADNMGGIMREIYRSWPGDGVGPSSIAAPGGRFSQSASPFSGASNFMMWWGLFRVPEDGYYHFRADVREWMGIEISGRMLVENKFPVRRYRHFHEGIWLNRGLHMIRFPLAQGRHISYLEWQPPGESRRVMGPDAFSPEMYPLILSHAARNRPAEGLEMWDRYVRRFPNDRRGAIMRLKTLALARPQDALGELENLMQRYPGSALYRSIYADCLWRLGRTGDALRHYGELAGMPARYNIRRAPAGSAAGLYREVFLRGQAPLEFAEELEDRVRDAGRWAEWLDSARKSGGAEGELLARLGGAMQLRALERQVQVAGSVSSSLTAAVAREKGELEAALALAENEEAEDDVRAEARQQVERIERKLDGLRPQVDAAAEKEDAAAQRASAFRNALRLGADAPAREVYYEYALNAVKEGSVSSEALTAVSRDLLEEGLFEAVKPLLTAIVSHSPDEDHVRWAADRMVDVARELENPAPAMDALLHAGWRDPGNRHYARWWLQRACELALEHGMVLDFARNAHILRYLHPDAEELARFLPRLGEVFERAGNYLSAEQEYRRVISTGDERTARDASMSLAEMFLNLRRPAEALEVLSDIIEIDIPQRGTSVPRHDGIEFSGVRSAGEHASAGGGKGFAPAGGGLRHVIAALVFSSPDAGGEPAEVRREDTEALLLASRCLLALRREDLALQVYRRAEAQPDFGSDVVPSWQYMMDLAGSLARVPRAMPGRRTDELEDRDVPPELEKRSADILDIVDRIFQFYADTMDMEQRVRTLLIRADANILVRNFPRAIEEIRQAAETAEDSPARHHATLKMGEVHVATEDFEQAISLFRRLAELRRRDVSPQALFWLGITQLALERRDEAIEAFRSLWERYAESEMVREAVYRIARTYADEGAFLEAIRLYEAVGAIESAPTEQVVPGEILTVKVEDADHFISTGMRHLPVVLTTPSGDEEIMHLEMNPINRSLFLGTIRTELGEPNPGDGVIQLYGNDVIYVTYTDRFRASSNPSSGPIDHVRTIHLVHDAEVQVSPARFVEIDEDDLIDEEDLTEEELEERDRLRALMPDIVTGRAVLRPGSDLFVRVEDRTLSRTTERDTATVEVFTYVTPERRIRRPADTEPDLADIRRRLESPQRLQVTSRLPDNRRPPAGRISAPRFSGNHVKVNSMIVELVETGSHTGIFYGSVRTVRSGPTAIASDFIEGNEAYRVIDGKNSADSAWQGFIDGRPDKWIEVDLKEVREISRIVWHRGEGADDRFMVDYTVTLEGDGPAEEIKITGNRSAQNNEIDLGAGLSARWVRFTAHAYHSDAPAIAQIEIYDGDGSRIVPAGRDEAGPEDEAVLEVDVGDYIAAEFFDERNINPGRPVTRLSSAMNSAFTDGYVDAVFISHGENTVGGAEIARIPADDGESFISVFGRRTKRVRPDAVMGFIVVDADLNVDDSINTAMVEIYSTSGSSIEVEVRQLSPESDIFAGSVYLATDEVAADAPGSMLVAPGDFVMLRYLDEENVRPGHAVYREAFVMVNKDEITKFPEGKLMVNTPFTRQEDRTAGLGVSLLAPDRVVPPADEVEVRALSFATGDSVRFNTLLRDLDGSFSAQLPMEIGTRPPAAERTEGADRTRRISPDRREFGIPMAIAGDDILWVNFTDDTPRQSAARKTVNVAGGSFLQDVQRLFNLDNLPRQARSEGVRIELADPHLELRELQESRNQALLKEIARKKVHYRRHMARYEAALEKVDGEIQELSERVGRAADAEPAAPGADVPAAPDDDAADATPGADVALPVEPGFVEETMEEEPAEVDDAIDIHDSQRLIRLGGLRRDREGLTAAYEGLKRRYQALGRYDTAKYEGEIKEIFERVYDARLAEEEERPVAVPEEEVDWFEKSDWWRHCALLPGVALNVVVDDPDIPQDVESLEVEVLVLGARIPEYRRFTAGRNDSNGAFETLIPTVREGRETGENALVLRGGEHIVLSYGDEHQTEFPGARSTFFALASDARMYVTDSDYLAERKDYKVGESIHLLVIDPDMSKTAQRDYVWATVKTEGGHVREVPLRETQPHSGEFRGSLRTRLKGGGGDARSGDGLAAAFGESFTVSYLDELGREHAEKLNQLSAVAAFEDPTDADLEAFARQLGRGALQRDVLFNTARALFELGKRAVEGGAVQRGRRQLLESRDEFLRLIAMYPEDEVVAHATYYLGNIFFLIGNFDQAVDQFRRVVERWPDSEFKAMSLFKLGMAHMEVGDLSAAVESFVTLAYHHGDSPLVADAMLAMSRHFSGKEETGRAIGIARAFLRKFPDHDETDNMYLRLGGWLITRNRLAEAVAVFEEAERKLPDSPQMPAFLYWHADCLLQMAGRGGSESAIIMLQRVMYDYSGSRWARFAEARLAEVQ